MLIKILLYLGIEVTAVCVRCADGGSELNGIVGGNITILYTIKSPFWLVKIYYNGTQNTITISSQKVSIKDVTDKRFIIPQNLSGTGNTRSIEITLTKLSFNDDNVAFDYTYTDPDLNNHFGSNTLKVNGRYLLISVSWLISLITKVSRISHVSSKNIYNVLYQYFTWKITCVHR